MKPRPPIFIPRTGTPLSATSLHVLSIVPSPPRTMIISDKEDISERGKPFILRVEAVSVSTKVSQPFCLSHGSNSFNISTDLGIPALQIIPILFIFLLYYYLSPVISDRF